MAKQTSRKAREQRTRFLAEGAVMLALATILSLIKIDLPLGGGITLVSMLPIVIMSHRWGWQKGLLVAFLHSAIQLLLGLDNVGYATSFGMALGVIFLLCLPLHHRRVDLGRVGGTGIPGHPGVFPLGLLRAL